MATYGGKAEDSIKYGWFKDKTLSKLVEFTPFITTSFYDTLWSPTLFTPTFQYVYTDIFAKSVIFCNSADEARVKRGWARADTDQTWVLSKLVGKLKNSNGWVILISEQ